MSSSELSTLKEQAEIIGVAKLGSIFAQSGYFRDVRDQAQAIVKILYGRELGFSPVVAMMGIHVIEGKPSLSSNLMATLIKRSPHYDYKILEQSSVKCVIEFFEGKIRDKNTISLGIAEFTMDDAKTAGVVRAGGGWTKYPKAMLFARALSAGMKSYCPDVSACPLYVPEELGATTNEDGDVVELPASARPVAVTTEPYTRTSTLKPVTPSDVKKALVSAAGGNPDEVYEPVRVAVTTEPYTRQSTLKQVTPRDVKEALISTNGGQIAIAGPGNGDGEAGGSVGVSSSASSAPAESEYITTPQRRELHAAFRKAVPEERKNDADTYFYDWLIKAGYEKNGEPSTGLIPASQLADVKKKLNSYAKSL